MSITDFQARALASLRATVAELRRDLGPGRNGEFAACAQRVLARMQVDVATAPALAEQHLHRWRQLTGVLPSDSASGPLNELRRHAAHIGRTLEQPIAPTAAWFKEAVEVTWHYLAAYEAALPKTCVRIDSESGQPQNPRQRLARYLTQRFPGLPPDVLESLRVVPGGRGKETSLIVLKANDFLPSRLVLRRDLTLTVTGTSAHAEFPLLQQAEALGIPVPTPILSEQDPSHLGGSFIIVAEIVNARVGGELFAELNDLSVLAASFAPDLTRAMARLHTLNSHPSGTDLGGHASGGTDPVDRVRGFQQMFRSIVAKPPLHVATELGFAWLIAHPLPRDRPRRLVHGDIGLHNVMVRDGELAAILDWELAHLGDPAEDIAYAWSPLLRHLLTFDEFVALYRQFGGELNACDPHAVAWYSVWAHTRNSVYVAMHYDWAAGGQRNDIECFNAAIDFFARTQHYIALELNEALKDHPA